MIYLALGATFVGFIVAFIFKDSKKWKDAVGFLLLVLATIIGVYVAVMYNDIEVNALREEREKQAQNEKVEKVKKFIDLTKAGLNRFVGKMEFLATVDSNLNMQALFKRNTDLNPAVEILQNQSLLEIISLETINGVTTEFNNLKNDMNLLEISTVDNDKFKKMVKTNKEIIHRIELYLDWESDFQNGFITEMQLKEYYTSQYEYDKQKLIKEFGSQIK